MINRFDEFVVKRENFKMFVFCCIRRVTINKTSDMDNNTDTLKKLSAGADTPNNQTKLASVSGTPLPPSQIKCNILKGSRNQYFFVNFSLKHFLFILRVARAEEEAVAAPAKLTNQLFVKSATNCNTKNSSNLVNGEETLNAATFVSVVSNRVACIQCLSQKKIFPIKTSSLV